MNVVCWQCKTTIPEDCQSCPSCGAEVDLFRTITGPRVRHGAPPIRPAPSDPSIPPAPPPRREPRPGPRDLPRGEDESVVAEPATRPKADRKPKPRPRPAPPPPPVVQAPPAHVPQAPAYPGPYQPSAQPPTAEAEVQRPKHWFGRLKDAITNAPGQAEPPAVPAPPPAAPVPPWGPAGMVPPHDPPPNGWGNGPAAPPAGNPAGPWPQQGQGGWAAAPAQPPAGGWQPGAGAPGSSWPAPGPGAWGPPPTSPYGHPPVPPPAGVDQPTNDQMTIGAQGVDLGRLKVQSHQHVLQIFDRSNQWIEWQRIRPAGLKVGRVKDSRQHPALSSMAADHLLLGYEGGRLVAGDLGSLNGVYRLVTQPTALEDGQRFRVGRYVLEFHAVDRAPETEPLVSEDGEEFCGADLPSLGHLDFIGRDGRPGPRHALTKGREPTVIGRGGRPGRPVDVALSDDDRISGVHAQLRPEGRRFFLEDLGSRNGTFVQLRQPTPVEPNDVLLVGQLLLRIATVGG